MHLSKHEKISKFMAYYERYFYESLNNKKRWFTQLIRVEVDIDIRMYRFNKFS